MKSEEPGADQKNFEYMSKSENEVIYVNRNDKVTVVFLANRALVDQSLGDAYVRMRDWIDGNESYFFITKYL